MNTDIRVKTTLLTHHKTLRLRKKLGAEGVLSLIALWPYAAQYRSDGDISDIEPEDLAAVAMWDKEPQHFLGALIEVGFIDESLNSDGVVTRQIHDWLDHNAYAAHSKQRSELARAMAQKRWGKRCEPDKSGSLNQQLLDISRFDAKGIAVGSALRNADSNAPSPIPFPTPNPSPKEKNCSERCDLSEPARPDRKISFGETHFKGITGELAGLWKEAYPLVDIKGQIKAMEAWIVANPTRRKKDWARFINNWLAREQDKAEIQACKTGQTREDW